MYHVFTCRRRRFPVCRCVWVSGRTNSDSAAARPVGEMQERKLWYSTSIWSCGECWMLIESRISFVSGQIAHVVDILSGLLPMKQSAEFMNGIKVGRVVSILRVRDQYWNGEILLGKIRNVAGRVGVLLPETFHILCKFAPWINTHILFEDTMWTSHTRSD